MDRNTESAVNNGLHSSAVNKIILQAGGIICLVFILYSFATMAIVFLAGAAPDTVEECFSMLNENRITGLLRLDILTVFIMPLYYVLFYSIYIALKKHDNHLMRLAVLLILAGLTMFLAAPSVFSYLHLSDKYALAVTEAEKSQLLSAGEAIKAADIWHGTGPVIGGILLQTGALIISFLMLGNNIFSRSTAVVGIITHGLDLLHIIISFFLPFAGYILMVTAGTLYLLWFLLIGLGLFRICRKEFT